MRVNRRERNEFPLYKFLISISPLFRRHTAIDEESPGSIPKSLTIAAPTSRDTSLDIPLDGENLVFPLPSSASTDQHPSVRRFEAKKPVPSSKESSSIKFQYPSTKRESLNIFNKSFRSPEQQTKLTTLKRSPDVDHKGETRLADLEGKVTIKLPSDELTTLGSSKDREDSIRIPSSPEDISDQEIVEVRKDSALFLEEAEGLPTLREILKSKGPRVVRPRRESSGYASNLGTFDEDRRNSSTVDAFSQDFSTSLKERRRSSTTSKRLNSRVVLGRAEESLTEDVEVGSMPTTELHRKVSGAGLEMPNIEEVKEILRDEAPSRQESLDNLCGLTKPINSGKL